jgi:hypothetical protein
VGGQALNKNAVTAADGGSGDNGQRNETQQQSAGKLFPLAVNLDQAGFAPRGRAERAQQRPESGQRENQQRAIHKAVKRHAGDLGKRMPGGLREPVKPRREQSAADKHHDQINDQRPERSHGATIRFHAIQAKREFGAIPARQVWSAAFRPCQCLNGIGETIGLLASER